MECEEGKGVRKQLGTKENLSPKAAKRRMVADYTGTETEEFILRSEPEEGRWLEERSERCCRKRQAPGQPDETEEKSTVKKGDRQVRQVGTSWVGRQAETPGNFLFEGNGRKEGDGKSLGKQVGQTGQNAKPDASQ